MAVSGYQNPLEYQMYSAFENKEEEDTPVTTTSLTETQPVTTTAAPTQTQLPRSSLDILQSAGIQPTQKTAASDILQGAGFTGAKDVLRSLYMERPGNVLEAEGVSAASILEDYRKEQAAFKQQQNLTNIATKAEEDLRKKEQDFIKNYKYNIPQYNPAKFETKFGTLDFSDKDFSPRTNDWVQTNDETKELETITYNLKYGGDTFVYLPEEFVLRGKDWGNGKIFNPGFLDKKALEELYTKGQAIDASSMGAIPYDTFLKNNPNYNGYSINKERDSFGRGFLFEEKDWFDFSQKYLNGKYLNTYNFESDIYNKTPILGIGEYNGELVYVKGTWQQGRDTFHNLRIDKTGTANGRIHTAPKDRGGVAGVFQDLGEFVASIPFAPEIAFIATGGNPYVYASMKALQVSGSGGKPSDVLKAAATAYVTASVGNELSTYGDAAGASIQAATGISATAATTIGNSLVHAGFNGFVAAATGQDVGDAMLTGAIAGGLNANAADITNTVFGGAENVATIASTLKLTVPQTQRIFTGALSSGAINSVVRGGDFFDAFSESLIVQGVSQSGANAVGRNLKGSLDPKAVKAIQDNTRIFLQATARAAVRGEDMETAIARVAPYLQGRAIGQTVNILTSKKD